MHTTFRRCFLTVLVVTSLTAIFSLSRMRAAEGFRDPLGGKGSAKSRGGGPTKAPQLQVALRRVSDSDEKNVLALSIRLEVAEGSYTYSTTPGFSGATNIKISKKDGVEPLGDAFTANREPLAELSELGEAIEKFKDGAVTWTRRFRLTDGAKPEEVSIVGRVKYQVCNKLNCTPHDETFDARLDSPTRVVLTANARELTNTAKPEPLFPEKPEVVPSTAAKVEASGPKPFESEVTPLRNKSPDPIKLRFRLAPDNAKSGELVTLSITMQLEPGWHTFALDQDPKNAGLPTDLSVTATNGLTPADDKFAPSLFPEVEAIDGGREQRIHHKEITWTRQFTVENEKYGVAGQAAYQICRMGQCRPLKKIPFSLGHIAEVAPTQDTQTPVTPKLVDTNVVPPKNDNLPKIGTDANDPAQNGNTAQSNGDNASLDTLLPSFKGKKFQPMEDQAEGGLGLYLIYAFLGGLILNVMPCVLPVIAIKVLSFVQQAGESRGRILALNLVYSLGVLVVFLGLASLAVFAKLGWGNLFQQTEFQVAMSVVVFAMGLSLMGVFEIPLPGMVGSAASHQHQEGLPGAFLTGVFATLLATPCSGPFLGVTLGWSVQQPALITYLIWFVMGIGMASPYVLLGFFPACVKYLPKPGNWMVTFKEVCGWILMGTVLFLMSSLKANWLFPMLIILLATGFSLWTIGNLYHINSPARRKWSMRGLATAVLTFGCWFAFGLADTSVKKHDLPWKSFAGDSVDRELSKGRTVLIDFTADWCLSCKTNEKLALNTAETLEIVKQHGVTTLKADWTDGREEITQWLSAFDSVSVPLTVIFPGGDPTRPIVIRDLYSKSTLLEKLGQAVDVKPSLGQSVSQR